MQNNVFLILSSSLSLYTFSVCYCCNIFLQNRLAFILRPTPNLPGKKIIHEYHTPSLGDPFKECPRDESMQMISVLLPSSSWSPDSFLLSGANLHTYLWEAAFVCLAGDRTGDLHMLGKFPCVELYFHTSYPHYSHKSFLLSYDLPDFPKESLVQEGHIADNTA